MGNKIITEKDFWMCTGGLMPTQFQSTQSVAKKKEGERYITKRDTATVGFADFSCKKLMLIMAIAVALIAVLTVATGGAALIAIGAIAGAAGAAFGAVVGSLICGQMVSRVRLWDNSKTNFKVLGTDTITGDHTMTCPLFGDKITYAPQIKSWGQALAVGGANLIGGIFEGMLAGAAIGMGGAAISGGSSAFAAGGVRGLGQAALQFAKSAPINVIKNIGASFGYSGGFSFTSVGTALGLRGLTATQAGLNHYGQTGESGWGAAGKGVFGMEEGMAHSAGNIATGKGTWQDITGLALLFSPVHKATEETKPTNKGKQVEGEPAKDGETTKADDAESNKPEDSEAVNGRNTKSEEAGVGKDGEAYEDGNSTNDPAVNAESARIQAGFDDLAARRNEMGLPEAGSEGDNATLAKLQIDGQEFDGINRGLQNPKTEVTLKANAQTKTHAEAESVQNAINAGKKGTASEAEMWVDRDACDACGKYNGIGSLARELGVEKIIVHSPSGTTTYYPPKSK